jgi:hypothetical protein
MRLTDKRRQELIERKDLVSIRGREFIALDVLDTPVELADPAPAEPATEPAKPAQKVVKDGSGKTDLAGSASSS